MSSDNFVIYKNKKEHIFQMNCLFNFKTSLVPITILITFVIYCRPEINPFIIIINLNVYMLP